jgi:PncC family amidohydrolase
VSEFLEGGAITYSNKLKVNVIKVNSNLLYRVGAVSEEVAYQMAVGALALASADYSVSITGIAGPTGATKAKPVGLVYFGFASKSRVITRKMVFSGNRRLVRDKSSRFAILMLRSFILGE